jgi:hypothetical protein
VPLNTPESAFYLTIGGLQYKFLCKFRLAVFSQPNRETNVCPTRIEMIDQIHRDGARIMRASNAIFMKPGSKRKNNRKGASANDKRDSACHPAATDFNHRQSQAKEDN